LLATAVRNTNLEICQLSRRPSPSRIARVICQRVCLDFASLGPAMVLSGSMPQDYYTLVFVTECPEKGRSFNFATEHTDGYMGFFSHEYQTLFGEAPSMTLARFRHS
jgi:hypothetical protein